MFYLALNGEEIIITENQQPSLKLTPLKSKPQRLPLFGTDKDIISMADNFDDPLEEFED